MAKVYCLCGFIGAGKTTMANRLVKEHGAYLCSADDWMMSLFGEGLMRSEFDANLRRLKRRLKSLAVSLAEIGTPVVLDWGFWRKQERKQVQEWGADNKLDVEYIYLHVPIDECLQRAIARNEDEQYRGFYIDEAIFNQLLTRFEPPTEEEASWQRVEMQSAH